MIVKITPQQCRAARALLGISQNETAAGMDISEIGLRKFETGTSGDTRMGTYEKMFQFFDNKDIYFTRQGGVEPRLEQPIRTLHGVVGIKDLWNDIYETLINHDNKEILIANNAEPTHLEKEITEYLDMHLERLKSAKITEKIMCCEGDTNFLGPITAYRWVPEDNFCDSPTFIYGDKVAMLIWGPPAKVTIINNPQYTESIRGLFKFSWDRARIPEIKE